MTRWSLGTLGTSEGRGSRLAWGARHHGLWAALGLTVGTLALSFSLFSRCRLGRLVAALPGGGGERRGAAGTAEPRFGGAGCSPPRLLPSQRGGVPGVGVCVRCKGAAQGALPGWWACVGGVALLSQCHLSRCPCSSGLSPLCRMTTSRAGRTTSPGMKVPPGWGIEGWVPAGTGRGDTLCLHPRAFPFRLGPAAGLVRAGKQQLVPKQPPSCSLNSALCRAGRRPALPGVPRREGLCLPPAACPSPSLPTPPPPALDTTKDPCQKVKCSRHKVCVAQGYQRAMCISRKKLEHR